jgi:small-conductance mechanosensitive channel
LIVGSIDKILEFTLVDTKYLSVNMVDVLAVLFIVLGSRAVVWLISRFLKRRFAHKDGDPGKAYAITQIAKYFIYTIAVVLILDSVGIKVTVLLAGSTALLVGLGLGLQDAFKDLVAGIIILTERTVTAHDIVEIDGIVGEVLEVGLRTTTIRTRDDIEMILPNARLTNERVVNWSRNKKTTRFAVEVGVAYGSDTQLVKTLLIEVAKQHKEVSKKQLPEVLFSNFGSSSLDFKLLFYSGNLFRIERVKSELRFLIDKAFRENNVVIAFPQMDVWLRQQPQNIPTKE